MTGTAGTDIPSGLGAWVVGQNPELDANALQPLSGDAGFRRYFRVEGSRPPVMAVFAPPATEDSARYLEVSAHLQGAGVRVPQVLATDLTRGFLLVEDVGDRLLLPALDSQSADKYYRQAMAQLLDMQRAQVPAGQLPVYDAQKLWDEMALFPTWLVRDLLELPLGRKEQHMFEEVFDWLINSAVSQPQVLVHRDYHSRNLMLQGHDLVTIDFQDAVIGPVTYDLVSLLKDCYIRWPVEQVNEWALHFRSQRLGVGLAAGESDAEFLRWFDLMGLQRHIKVLGIFARLWLRDGKPGYLNDLPLVLLYTLEAAARYAECAEFAEWLEVRLLPSCERQSWWKVVTP